MCENWRGTLLAFDASSIIHAWDHYPLAQFPRVWVWLGEEFGAGQFVMSEVADDETKKRAPGCHTWLHHHSLRILPVTQAILDRALQIKAMLGIVSDRDYRGGVGENDLLIIATSVNARIELISNEGRQNALPSNLANCKIPAVCNMAPVNSRALTSVNCSFDLGRCSPNWPQLGCWKSSRRLQ